MTDTVNSIFILAQPSRPTERAAVEIIFFPGQQANNALRTGRTSPGCRVWVTRMGTTEDCYSYSSVVQVSTTCGTGPILLTNQWAKLLVEVGGNPLALGLAAVPRNFQPLVKMWLKRQIAAGCVLSVPVRIRYL